MDIKHISAPITNQILHPGFIKPEIYRQIKARLLNLRCFHNKGYVYSNISVHSKV